MKKHYLQDINVLVSDPWNNKVNFFGNLTLELSNFHIDSYRIYQWVRVLRILGLGEV
ncbi:MAG: hypothetical protein QNJ49_04560 [Mastigocoleus sp. MO_167.B18]|uniref:hypothetical protein n=1 Tax=Mastigocoleus sp. MO_188.B34 TaxID=3036635 RepID=UPI00262C75EE|nr:hypothetical protein [Mastigocoleus sp. MO_188.B34]MDJ0697853.1 hypothetical protein [Mastigocoleus sp. MO_188.B34]MDJ0772691.1 hypothetical protein [Mastigocoleus sp. MO_167.B18]